MFFSKCLFPLWKASLKNSHLSVSILRKPWAQTTPSYLRMNGAETEKVPTSKAKQDCVLVTPKLKATISRYKLAVLVRRMQSVNPKQVLHIGIRKKSKMIKILNFWQQHTKNTPLNPEHYLRKMGKSLQWEGIKNFSQLPVCSSSRSPSSKKRSSRSLSTLTTIQPGNI